MKWTAQRGSVVRALHVGLDFGKITYRPGDYGIICAQSEFKPTWFVVHWPSRDHFDQFYTCNVSDHDVEVLSETEIDRIEGDVPICHYCKIHPGKVS